jgi:predicted transcriptional regulator
MEDQVPDVPDELREIILKLRRGESVTPITVRQLLGYFGAKRRGIYVIEMILDTLNEAGVKTEPDFRELWIEAPIELVRVPSTNAVSAGEIGSSPPSTSGVTEHATTVGAVTVGEVGLSDPTLKIRVLDAANRGVVGVKPDEPISLAITRMLEKDYSQLPVTTNLRSPKGMISWSSIGAGIGLNNRGDAVRHYMEKAYIVDADEALLDALPIIVQRGYVLVQKSSTDPLITGIVTAADLSIEFKRRAEPFLLLSEIEQQVRNLIEGKISIEELETVKNPSDKNRTVNRVADLTFFEYILVFQKPEFWDKINLDGIHKEEFTTILQNVLSIRNDVMHINPDPIGADELESLQKCAKFFQRLQTIRRLANQSAGEAKDV